MQTVSAMFGFLGVCLTFTVSLSLVALLGPIVEFDRQRGCGLGACRCLTGVLLL